MHMPMGNPEVGKELNALELSKNQVVVVHPPPYVTAFTIRVVMVETQTGVVVFHAPDFNWVVINKFDDAGKIFDDRGEAIHVYEYLGVI